MLPLFIIVPCQRHLVDTRGVINTSVSIKIVKDRLKCAICFGNWFNALFSLVIAEGTNCIFDKAIKML